MISTGLHIALNGNRFRFYCKLVLFLTIIMVYYPVLDNGFVWDDYDYVINNAHVNSGLKLSNIKWALSAEYSANWHPLTWISHMVDCENFGLRAAGHHFVSILLHAAVAIVFLNLLLLLNWGFYSAFFTAAFFALHPVNVECVAWISQRKTLICVLFTLFSIRGYVLYALHGKLKWYLISIACFLLAISSKPVAVSLPLLLAVLDFWPLSRFSGLSSTKKTGLFLEKIPYILISIAGALLTISAQHADNAIRTFDKYSVVTRTGNAFVSLWLYLGKLFWPFQPLSIFYPYRNVNWLLSVLAIAAFVLICLFCLKFVKRSPWFIAGWTWFVVALAPTLGIIQAGDQSHANRYLYLPMIGILVVLSSAIQNSRIARAAKGFLCVAGIAAVVVVSFCTKKQLGFWKDEVTVFSHVLSVAGPSPLVHNNLGWAYLESGDLKKAQDHFIELVRLKPSVVSYNNLAYAYIRSGDYDSVLNVLSGPEIKSSLDATSMMYQAGALAKLGRIDESIQKYRNVLEIDPENKTARRNLAQILMHKSKFGQPSLPGPGENIDPLKGKKIVRPR